MFRFVTTSVLVVLFSNLTFATLGKGTILVNGEEIDPNVNRDINATQIITKDERKGGLNIDMTVDTRYITNFPGAVAEDVKAIKELPQNTIRAGQRIGDATGDLIDSAVAGATQGVNPITDYQKSTAQREAANRIHQDNPQLGDGTSVKDVLNNKDQYSPEQYREALNVYGGYVANELGVDPSSVHIYAQDDGNAGMSDRDNPNAYVNADNTNMTDTEQLVGVTSHELGHQRGENETEAERSRKQGVRAWNTENKYNGETAGVGTNESHQDWNQSNQNSVVFTDGNKSVNSVENADYLPADELIKNSKVTSEYQKGRTHPTSGVAKDHNGTDISTIDQNKNKDVHAAADGVVTFGAEKEIQGYGNMVEIVHKTDNGTYMTRSAHMDEVYVKSGDKIKEGQPIGQMGSSGKTKDGKQVSTGEHLHFEMNKWDADKQQWNQPENPRNQDGTFKNIGNYEKLEDIPEEIRENR